MFLVIGILFFLAWVATFFFFLIGHIITYIFLFVAIIAIVLHFVLMFRRRSAGKTQI